MFYDVTLSDAAAGPLTGEEHSTWDGGTKIDGTYVGTARLTPSADSFILTLDYDESITVVDSVRNDVRPGHRTKELTVGPAATGDCDCGADHGAVAERSVVESRLRRTDV